MNEPIDDPLPDPFLKIEASNNLVDELSPLEVPQTLSSFSEPKAELIERPPFHPFQFIEHPPNPAIQIAPKALFSLDELPLPQWKSKIQEMHSWCVSEL